jgi:hypothetical protein
MKIKPEPPNPSGLCMCGCGGVTPIAKRSISAREIVRGEHTKFLLGHRTSGSISGENSPHWSGGRFICTTGYVKIANPESTCRKDRYQWEHRAVVESDLGRRLLPSEVVHHMNGVRDDNRIENLLVFASSGEHTRFEAAHARAMCLLAEQVAGGSLSREEEVDLAARLIDRNHVMSTVLEARNRREFV